MNDHSSRTRSCSAGGGRARARASVPAHSRSRIAHASWNPSTWSGCILARSGMRRLSSASTSGPMSTPLIVTSLDLAGDLDVVELEADEAHVVEGDGAQVGVLDVGAPCQLRMRLMRFMSTTLGTVPDVPLPHRARRCHAFCMSETSPTARALRALEILQNHPGCTADQLAERLGVTDRAARRYVAILREAGIPVESVRGPYGGYRLGRGLRLPPLVFSGAEALGLVMAVLDGRHAAADNDDPVGSGLGKIIRALPHHVGRQAATMREHARAVPDRWARPDPAITSALVGGRGCAAAGAHRLSQRRRSQPLLRGRSVVRGRALRAVVPPLLRPPRRCRAHLSDRPGDRGRRGHADLQDAGRARPGRGAGGEPRHRLGARHAGSSSRRPRPRWRRTCAPRWGASSRWTSTGASSSAAPATRRCMRGSGWRGCHSSSWSRVGRSCARQSPRSRPGWPGPCRTDDTSPLSGSVRGAMVEA